MTEAKRGTILDWCLCGNVACPSCARYVKRFTGIYGHAPSEADVALDAMIKGVVAGIAAKLEANGSTDPARDAIAALFGTGGAS